MKRGNLSTMRVVTSDVTVTERFALAETLDRLLPDLFPIRGPREGECAVSLELVKCGSMAGLLLSGESPCPPWFDDFWGVLAMRRGVSYTNSYSAEFQVRRGAKVADWISTLVLDLPLATVDGWMIIDGATYPAEAVIAEIQGRLPRWLATCARSTAAWLPDRAPVELDDDALDEGDDTPDERDDDAPIHFHARKLDEVFAPSASPVVAPRRTRVPVAEADGYAAPTGAGCVYVSTDDHAPNGVRAYLSLDDEEALPERDVVRGEPLFVKVERVSVAVDARGPIEVRVREGDRIVQGDEIAVADGVVHRARSTSGDLAGIVRRVELYNAGPWMGPELGTLYGVVQPMWLGPSLRKGARHRLRILVEPGASS